MITRIREVRRARSMTLDDVARQCRPPTTPQTIGRLEMGTRTVSVGWLNRIAEALGVEAASLVDSPDRVDVPVVAILGSSGAVAPRRAAIVAPPRVEAGLIAITVASGVGDYRAGDEIWCEQMEPAQFGRALNRDLIVPRPAGRFLFGRLIGREASPGDGQPGKLHVLPLGAGSRQTVLTDPVWAAVAVKLVRTL